jgi:phosphatidylinositol 4-kinase
MSNMYSLLNYIAATSKEIYESSASSPMNEETIYISDHTTIESGLRGLSDDEKRIVGISTISVVTRLALEFGMEEVTVLPTLCVLHLMMMSN